MLCARTTPRPARAGQTIAGRGTGGERVLAFAGTLARPHNAVAGLQGAAWALRTSVYLLPQLSKINPCPQGSPEGSAPPTAAGQHPRRGLLPALRETCPGAAVPVLALVGTRGWRSLQVSVDVPALGGRRLPASIPVAKATPSIAVPTATSLGTLRSGILERGASGSAVRSGPAQVHAVRSARPARAGPRWPWVAARRLPGSSRCLLRSPPEVWAFLSVTYSVGVCKVTKTAPEICATTSSEVGSQLHSSHRLKAPKYRVNS